MFKLRVLASGAMVLASIVAPALKASAAAQVSIVGDSNITKTGTISVHYAGITPYSKVFVQQCVKPDGPRYDWSLWCPGDRTLVTPLLDKAEGDLAFEVFVGDDPSYSYPYSCGPTASAGYQVFDTCYLRFVETDMNDTDHDVFLPLTFAGASAAPATTTAPTSTAPSSVAASAPGTTDARRVTVSVGAPSTKASSNRLLVIVSGVAALVAGAAVTTLVVRAARSRTPANTDRAPVRSDR